MKNSNIKFFLTMAIGTSSASVMAVEIDYSIGYGFTHSDNIRQASTNAQSEVIHRVDMGLLMRETGPLLQSDTRADVRFNKYNNESFDDTTTGTLTTINSISLLPGSIRWNLDDYLAYSPINSTGVTTPNNFQQTNLFSTGPEFIIGITPVDRLELSGRYEKYSEEDTTRDSTRDLYAVRYAHSFSAINRMTINYEKRKYEFDDPSTNVNYDRDDVFIGYTSRSSATEYLIELGSTSYERVDGTSGDGFRGRIGLLRRMPGARRLSFVYRDQLSDVAEELGTRSGVPTIIVEGVPVVSSSDVFRVKNTEINFETIDGRDITRFRLGYDDVNYEQATDDQITKSASIDYSHSFSSRHQALFNAAYTDREFTDLNRTNLSRTAGVAYNYYLNKNLLVGFDYTHQHQTSTDATLVYTENRVTINLRYQTRDQNVAP